MYKSYRLGLDSNKTTLKTFHVVSKNILKQKGVIISSINISGYLNQVFNSQCHWGEQNACN